MKAVRIFVLITAGVLFLFSLLAILPAPINIAWKFAILATERGHYIAPLGLLFLVGGRSLRSRSRGRMLRIAAILGLASTVLLLSPLVRAWRVGGARAVDLGALISGRNEVQAQPLRLYYSSDSLAIDYYAPQSTDFSPPLVVVIHGGSWRGGSLEDLPGLNHVLAQQGYAVAAIAYRFAPAHRFPAQAIDVRSAISLLRLRADELGFDPNAIALLGRSAGGHLALLAAYTQSDSAIKGVISFYGPTDLVWGYEHPAARLVIDSRGTLKDFIGGTPTDKNLEYRQASPLSYVRNAPPTLLIHGTRDELVDVRNSRRLASALTRAGKPVTFLELPWATHGCDYFLNGPCGQVSTAAVITFLDQIFPHP